MPGMQAASSSSAGSADMVSSTAIEVALAALSDVMAVRLA
jgi:hypothetical protein